mgnify:CR=1 FL=1
MPNTGQLSSNKLQVYEQGLQTLNICVPTAAVPDTDLMSSRGHSVCSDIDSDISQQSIDVDIEDGPLVTVSPLSARSETVQEMKERVHANLLHTLDRTEQFLQQVASRKDRKQSTIADCDDDDREGCAVNGANTVKQT